MCKINNGRVISSERDENKTAKTQILDLNENKKCSQINCKANSMLSSLDLVICTNLFHFYFTECSAMIKMYKLFIIYGHKLCNCCKHMVML